MMNLIIQFLQQQCLLNYKKGTHVIKKSNVYSRSKHSQYNIIIQNKLLQTLIFFVKHGLIQKNYNESGNRFFIFLLYFDESRKRIRYQQMKPHLQIT